ncbi:MAG: phage tail sheath C-terminal domain-containing protein [Pseudomonadota bacterium]
MGVKTPGVYIEEVSAFPTSIAQVETAVPAFIGYTETSPESEREAAPGTMKRPVQRIDSLRDFEHVFGGPPQPRFALSKFEQVSDPSPLSDVGSALDPDPMRRRPEMARAYGFERVTPNFGLYDAMRLYFANGGGRCYVVSVGSYGDEIAAAPMIEALQALKEEPSITLVVIPELAHLSYNDVTTVQAVLLRHCGQDMGNRFALLDVPAGYLELSGPRGKPIERFRQSLPEANRDYAAAYYPWLETTQWSVTDLDLRWIDTGSREVMFALLRSSVGDDAAALSLIEDLSGPDAPKAGSAKHAHLLRSLPLYESCLNAIAELLNVQPAAAAVAGVYGAMDEARGVWTAPAGQSLNLVVMPSVNLTDQDQSELFAPSLGASINPIRRFKGRGTLVWGARTLADPASDWRYVPVRRLALMLEASLQDALRSFVFEANDAATWALVTQSFEAFLMGLWRNGALVGTKPEEAFAVRVGLGSTMTEQDLEAGILRVSVLFAVVRPAEFMALSLKQKMVAP